MSLNAAGMAATPDALKLEVYLPDRQGSLQVEMLAASRRHGAISYQLPPQLTDLLSVVAERTPVVILQNLGFNWYPVWHYAVVIGYDIDRKEITLRSGRERRQVMPIDAFEYTWKRGDYWAMVTLSPGKIPGNADEHTYVSAVTELERLYFIERAYSAYKSATKRWPSNLLAQIGVGNTAYRMHDLAQAEGAFRQAVLDHPDSVAALNNLAQTLSDLGRNTEALPFARHAVHLGGPLSEIAKSTLLEIEERLR